MKQIKVVVLILVLALVLAACGGQAAEQVQEAVQEAAEQAAEPQEEAAEEPAEEEAAPAEEEAEAEAPEDEPEPTPEPEESDEISFAANIFPILENRCIDCHGTDGGWDATTYDLFMTTGDHSPVVIPGDAEGSLLAKKLLGTHEEGDLMPPPPLRKLPDEVIQIFLDWIAAGALDN